MDTRTRPSRRYSRKIKNSRGLPVTKDVGSQLCASDSVVCDVLEGRPPLGFNQGPVLEPIRNGLLADARPLKKSGNAVGKRRLATRDLNGAPKRSNVLFLHTHPLYTSMLVKVNRDSCYRANKEICTVLPMPERARKPSQAAVDKRHRSHGKDGKTLAERIDEAMLLRDMDEAALVKRANEIAGEIEEGKPLVTQQSVNLIRKKDGGTKASRLVPILAEALDVRAVWLQWGIGERIDNRIAIPELIKSLTAARKG